MKIGAILLILALISIASISAADSFLATRTIRSHTVLTASDIEFKKNDLPSAIEKLSDIIGLESRVVLYEGRPISANDVGPATIVSRNQVVTLIYLRENLAIAVEARALARAGVGETVRVMNLSSRNTLNGTVASNGNVIVGN